MLLLPTSKYFPENVLGLWLGRKANATNGVGVRQKYEGLWKGEGKDSTFFLFFFLSFYSFPFPSRFDSFHLSTISKARWRPKAPTLRKRKTRECPVRDCQSYLVLYAIFVICSTPICLRKKLAVIVAERIMASEVLKQRSKRFCFSHQAHIVSSVKSKPSLKESRMTMVSISVSHHKCSIKGAKCYGDFCPEWGLLMV